MFAFRFCRTRAAPATCIIYVELALRRIQYLQVLQAHLRSNTFNDQTERTKLLLEEIRIFQFLLCGK